MRTTRTTNSRQMKTGAGFVLTSLKALTYWEVRLDLSFVAASLDNRFDLPANATCPLSANNILGCPCI